MSFFLIRLPSVPSHSYKGAREGRLLIAFQRPGSGQRLEQVAGLASFPPLCQRSTAPLVPPAAEKENYIGIHAACNDDVFQ